MKLDNEHIIIYSYAINIAFFSFNWSSCWRTTQWTKLCILNGQIFSLITITYSYLYAYQLKRYKLMFTMCMELQIMLII